jgi:hypothetical protein
MRCEKRCKEASEAAAGDELCRPVPCAGERACSWASALLGYTSPASARGVTSVNEVLAMRLPTNQLLTNQQTSLFTTHPALRQHSASTARTS